MFPSEVTACETGFSVLLKNTLHTADVRGFDMSLQL